MSTYSEILADYAKRAHRAPRLTIKEEHHLIAAALRDDEQAKIRLIESNIYLVLMIARRYQLSGEIMADILQEGHIGLIQAIDHFELKRNIRLSTYAVWWIRRTIQDFLEKNHKQIRLPRNIQQTIRSIQEAHFLFYQRLGRSPSNEEISDYLDLPLKKITQIALHGAKTSIDNRAEDHEENSIEYIESDSSQQPEQQLLYKALREAVDHATNSLSEEEREVLELRFHPLTKHTLKDIGNQLRLNEYEVRKRLDSALRKMRKLTQEFI